MAGNVKLLNAHLHLFKRYRLGLKNGIINYNLINFMNKRKFSSFKISEARKYKRCYEVLGVDEGCDQETIRKAYIALVKKYHPDSGNQYASAEKFQEIDKAFKELTNKLSKERWDVVIQEEEVQEKDIQHTAPQHRQYLSYEGYGSGNPFQREKQYTKKRAMQAAENVLKHRIEKSIAEEEANALMVKVPLKHKIKTKYGFDRLVEDLIQESMARGDFNNLQGKGKPLENTEHRNPYVDLVTQKLNQVLIDNGFTPEWIMLQKEIRQEADILRNELSREREKFGKFPLSTEDHIEWSNIVYKFENLVNQINKKINKYNLVVPILNKQMVLVDLTKESKNVLINGKFNENGTEINKSANNYSSSNAENSSNNSIFGFLDSLFKQR